ncbi:MAG: glycosyltransferase [Isosphaeraceae bacterium]|nr:glycosyltransferase [Isosphaeraceae bacterium]
MSGGTIDHPRIALVTRRYPPLIGGAERVLSYLAPALAAEGAEVVVVTAQVPGLPAEAYPPSSVPVVRLPTARTRFVGTWLYMRNLARWFARNPIDLAYVSMLKHDAYVAIGVGRRLGFPVVLRPEGAGATGDLAWQSWGRFGRTIGRRCRQADAVVAISPAIRAELLAAGYDPARIHDLPNGVPVPEEPWQPRAGWREAPQAIFVGRLAPEKGLDTLVAAWTQVRAEHPRARLALLGEGPMRPVLEEQIARLGLADAIVLAGPAADVTDRLRAADLFVLPSREEGMSIALLEAMALGLPAVATAIPGNLGLMTNGVHGRLTPPDDPEGLARAILAQWADPDAARAMAAVARGRVMREFSIAAVARRHLDLFQRLIRAKNRSRWGAKRRPD